MFGIPYARADVDADGYFVTCPECGEKFHDQGDAPHEVTLEDAETKGASAAYAIHYEETHR